MDNKIYRYKLDKAEELINHGKATLIEILQ